MTLKVVTEDSSSASAVTESAFSKFPLLTVAATAKMMELSCVTLNVWRHTKRYPLPYVMVGTAIRYRREDVIDFLRKGVVSGLESPSPDLPRRRGGPGRPKKGAKRLATPASLPSRQSQRPKPKKASRA